MHLRSSSQSHRPGCDPGLRVLLCPQAARDAPLRAGEGCPLALRPASLGTTGFSKTKCISRSLCSAVLGGGENILKLPHAPCVCEPGLFWCLPAPPHRGSASADPGSRRLLGGLRGLGSFLRPPLCPPPRLSAAPVSPQSACSPLPDGGCELGKVAQPRGSPTSVTRSCRPSAHLLRALPPGFQSSVCEEAGWSRPWIHVPVIGLVCD